MSGRVVHFEIPADDPARAQDFYWTAFGWDINAMPDMGVIRGDDGDKGLGGARGDDVIDGRGGEDFCPATAATTSSTEATGTTNFEGGRGHDVLIGGEDADWCAFGEQVDCECLGRP